MARRVRRSESMLRFGKGVQFVDPQAGDAASKMGMKQGLTRWVRDAALFAVLLFVLGAFMGCAASRSGVYQAAKPTESFQRVATETPVDVFVPSQAAPSRKYANSGEVDHFSKAADQGYKLGPGDRFSFVVRGRNDISREEIVVSPDGEIALPRAGVIHVAGRSLKQVTEELTTLLGKYYDAPEVTLVMKTFVNNRVFVLGRVANPGAVTFNGRGSMLEALSLAGGLPVDAGKSFLSRCMIVRGSEMVIWIDLRDLLENGNMALNAKLQNGDVIFIPQSEDQLAYVLGQVQQPGVQLLRSSQTVLDAVMSHGGPTSDANLTQVFLARQVNGKGIVEEINLREIIAKADMRKNYVLKEGDIIYLSERGASKVNYFLTKLMPSMAAVDFSIRTAESLGAMADLRKRIWGQEGFGNSSTVSPSGSSSGK